LAQLHRDLIISVAARHNLPAIYFERFFVTDGGLISYGTDFVDQYRRAGGYVHRILNGEKPADLPVQAPTKYELPSISKPRRRLALTCHLCCSRAQTPWSNSATTVRNWPHRFADTANSTTSLETYSSPQR
jgi:hypothetical protein